VNEGRKKVSMLKKTI